MRQLAFALASLLATSAVIPVCAAETLTVRPANIVDEKAVFATVESANVVPARARIGGTVAELVRPRRRRGPTGTGHRRRRRRQAAADHRRSGRANRRRAVAAFTGADRSRPRRGAVPPGRRHPRRDGPGPHRDGSGDLDHEGPHRRTRRGAPADWSKAACWRPSPVASSTCRSPKARSCWVAIRSPRSPRAISSCACACPSVMPVR